MLQCAVKFCGGCNPRFDRGAVYQIIKDNLSDIAVFSYPEDNAEYDVLLIIRGCTGCPYLYEEIKASHRIVLTSESETTAVTNQIRQLI